MAIADPVIDKAQAFAEKFGIPSVYSSHEELIARDEIGRLCGIAPPWRMLGAVAIGHPDAAAASPASPGRKPIDRVAEFIE